MKAAGQPDASIDDQADVVETDPTGAQVRSVRPASPFVRAPGKIPLVEDAIGRVRVLILVINLRLGYPVGQNSSACPRIAARGKYQLPRSSQSN